MNTTVYNCLIVDDEPIARNIVQTYIDQLPQLQCKQQAKNAIEALAILSKENTIDIVFLDINLPNLSGIGLAKVLSTKPKLIFTTAYSEYAVESYEINATDYLLKPFTFERFTKAVFKAIASIEKEHLEKHSDVKDNKEIKLFIKSNGKNYPIAIQDILYCEAKKNYTKIVLSNNKSYIPLIPLSKLEQELNTLYNGFIRIHRSFIINTHAIASIGTNHLFVGTHQLPIGEQFKIEFFEKMGIKK
jgi:DNA-binding LytR/AlgR family response regulator